MTADDLAKRLREDGHVVTLMDRTNDEGAAACLEVSVRLLREWRRLSQGPGYLIIAGRVWYQLEDLAAYLKLCLCEPER